MYTYKPAPEHKTVQIKLTKNETYKPAPEHKTVQTKLTKNETYKPAPEHKTVQTKLTKNETYKPAPEQKTVQTKLTKNETYKPAPEHKTVQTKLTKNEKPRFIFGRRSRHAFGQHHCCMSQLISCESNFGSQFINPFTAPACKISGLKDAQTCLQTVYFPVL